MVCHISIPQAVVIHRLYKVHLREPQVFGSRPLHGGEGSESTSIFLDVIFYRSSSTVPKRKLWRFFAWHGLSIQEMSKKQPPSFLFQAFTLSSQDFPAVGFYLFCFISLVPSSHTKRFFVSIVSLNTEQALQKWNYHSTTLHFCNGSPCVNNAVLL